LHLVQIEASRMMQHHKRGLTVAADSRGARRDPTIRDVADRAGVSKSLVSLVLREAPHVSETRRRQVLRAIEELGYKPNRMARGLTTARSDTFGILLNDLSNPWFVDLLAGLTASIHAAGLGSIIADSHIDLRVGRRSVETLVAQGIDGLVVVGTTTEAAAIRAASPTVPIVLAGTREPDLANVDIAVNDDHAGATLATEHLIKLGHRRIAHLRGPGIVGDLRQAGYRDTMDAAGLRSTNYEEFGGMSEDSGYSAARRLLTRPDRPTAIFAYNDITAIATLSAADDLNLGIPDDLSVVGYDNTYLSRIRHLSLTSVDNGNFAVGVQAGKFLLERLDSPHLPQRIHLVGNSLHVRRSTGTAPIPS
jgi:DNA-binding LacI/PurR family transcriptional regulator